MIEAGERDRGSGTVLMVAVLSMAGVLITITLGLASAIVARHRAGAIADLSALAAAAGPPGAPACARARRVADRDSGRLTGCRILADGSVVVSVEVSGSGLPGPARGSARAGRSVEGPPTAPP